MIKPLIKCVVPISGGKDSQLCAKLAVEEFGAEHVHGLFCDTKFEHPLTYEHIPKIAAMYGIKITTVNAGSVPEQVAKYEKFPTGKARFCTYNLKIVPSNRWYEATAINQSAGFEVWVGVRWGESSARAKRYVNRVSDETMPLHEFMPKKYPKRLASLGIMARLPIVDWTTEEVMNEMAGTLNPLYEMGFSRVGCFPCLAAGDAHKEKAFNFDESGKAHLRIARNLEPIVGRSVFTSKGGQLRNDTDFQGCSICAI